MLRVYNTLTKNKEEFKPHTPSKVRLYTCGVTVYDHCHIGHGRSLYIFEVIRRYLKYKGFEVKFIRNITDIDDKIINKAREWAQAKGLSLEEAYRLVKDTYINSYYQDLDLLKIPPADVEPRATENIEDMVEFIKKIIDKGYGYQKENNVYFRVKKFTHYGKLSGKRCDELLQNVRIEPDPLKEDPLDFALWKGKKSNEPWWPSPFGEGRPGWHIECSVMSTKFLGVPLDIHGGGRDLIFPHHENEIAQSESVFDSSFSLYWLHHGLITVNKEKMAKSLGNFYTIKDILRNHHQEDLKLFYLSAHYSSSLDFSWERLKEAESQRRRLYIIYDRLKDIEINPYKTEEIIRLKDEFEEAMDDDFNMPKAKNVLFVLSSLVTEVADKEILGEAKNLFLNVGKIFCLFERVDECYSVDFKKYIEEKIKERETLRREKKFAEADKIRSELASKGVILEDLKDGTTLWRVKRE